MSQCKICGKWDCPDHAGFVGRVFKKTFSGSSPPEIFVGKWNYPNVYAGLVTPEQYGDTNHYTSAEKWYDKKYPLDKIKSLRTELLYGRTITPVKKPDSRIMQTVKEVAMTSKPIATEMTLKKAITTNAEKEQSTPLITRAAPVERVRLEENTTIEKKVEYLVNDVHAKAQVGIQELYKSQTPVSTIMKILSAGLLGQGPNRKLVPTRWSITAVDDTLSRKNLEKIRDFKEMQEIEVFTNEYVGNHYEFLLLPGPWSFEVIELSHTGLSWQDHETTFPRRAYAESVTGAYYANRLAVTEYLLKIQRQATVLVLREIRPEYNVACGVGILRECSRGAFQQTPQRTNTLKETYARVQSRLNQPLSNWVSKSVLLKTYGKQKKILEFINA